MAAALILGFAVRLAGILFTVNLWLGLYLHLGEWPWRYVFIIFVLGPLVVRRPGYDLGLDGLLARMTS